MPDGYNEREVARILATHPAVRSWAELNAAVRDFTDDQEDECTSISQPTTKPRSSPG